MLYYTFVLVSQTPLCCFIDNSSHRSRFQVFVWSYSHVPLHFHLLSLAIFHMISPNGVAFCPFFITPTTDPIEELISIWRQYSFIIYRCMDLSFRSHTALNQIKIYYMKTCYWCDNISELHAKDISGKWERFPELAMLRPMIWLQMANKITTVDFH